MCPLFEAGTWYHDRSTSLSLLRKATFGDEALEIQARKPGYRGDCEMLKPRDPAASGREEVQAKRGSAWSWRWKTPCTLQRILKIFCPLDG